MTGFIMFLHAVACVVLVTAILMQSGRGGGLTEAFSSAESMFGAQTSSFMIRVTSVLAVVFFTSSLALAVMSSRTDRSLLEGTVILPDETQIGDQAPVGTDTDGASASAIDAAIDQAQGTLDEAIEGVESGADDATTSLEGAIDSASGSVSGAMEALDEDVGAELESAVDETVDAMEKTLNSAVDATDAAVGDVTSEGTPAPAGQAPSE
jgi:preprotein translocase subunit SecG